MNDDDAAEDWRHMSPPDDDEDEDNDAIALTQRRSKGTVKLY